MSSSSPADTDVLELAPWKHGASSRQNFILKQKISLWVTVVVGMLLLVGAYMFIPNLRGALKLMKLNGDPALEALNIVLIGEVSQIEAGGFVLANGGEALRINTDGYTRFSKSGNIEEIVKSTLYAPSDIADGDLVRVNAFISEGKIWARGVIFVSE